MKEAREILKNTKEFTGTFKEHSAIDYAIKCINVVENLPSIFDRARWDAEKIYGTPHIVIDRIRKTITERITNGK